MELLKLYVKEVYFICSRKIIYFKCIYICNFFIFSGIDNDRLNVGKLLFFLKRNYNLSINKCMFIKVYRKKSF